jgi:hypothetical protein
MLQSLSSADRYPRGTVSLLDTQMVSTALASSLQNGSPQSKQRLVDWPGVDKALAERIARYEPAITRRTILSMPLSRQVEMFGLTFEEAVTLRRSIADIASPNGPPPVKQRPNIQVPLVKGLGVRDAEVVLGRAGLQLGEVTKIDSPLPASSIVTQNPAPGGDVKFGMTVNVEIASGLSVRLPAVVGLGFTEAACLLRSAGLRSEPSLRGTPGPHMQIVAIEPPAGTLVTPKTPITIQLEQKPEPKELRKH